MISSSSSSIIVIYIYIYVCCQRRRVSFDPRQVARVLRVARMVPPFSSSVLCKRPARRNRPTSQSHVSSTSQVVERE